ncbi:hypothetical protein L195_g053657 [Trifolium pratense]|uniref:Uncharacterized protein n=1 Tax=Trifolium pratense TaxID=57577 RepID=A0A2K3KBS0_TRIPR|nr:hypothetical protein L195_g053657 [Trifolium pratense]
MPTGSSPQNTETKAPSPKDKTTTPNQGNPQENPPISTTPIEENVLPVQQQKTVEPPLVQVKMNEPTDPIVGVADAAVHQAMEMDNEHSQQLEGAHSTTNNHRQPSAEGHGAFTMDTNEFFNSSADYAQTRDSFEGEGTSVSKPPHSIRLPTEVLQGLKNLAPEDALNKLLSEYTHTHC